MKKTSANTPSRSPTRHLFSDVEKIFYTGPVDWTNKTISPYRPITSLKPPQPLQSKNPFSLNNNISETVLSKIFGSRMIKEQQ